MARDTEAKQLMSRDKAQYSALYEIAMHSSGNTAIWQAHPLKLGHTFLPFNSRNFSHRPRNNFMVISLL